MQKICYTCVNDRLYTVNMFRNGVKEKTLVEKADDSIPLWFRKAGIYSPLPRKLTCDPKYNAFKNPIKKWKPHSPAGADYQIRIPKESVEKIGYGKKRRYPHWMYFWASQERQLDHVEPMEAEEAYDSFYNSGLVKADSNGDFVFRMYLPTPYLVEGVMYTPHVHLAFVKENKTWDVNTWSVSVFPYLDRKEYQALVTIDRYLFINDAKKATPESIQRKVDKHDYLRGLFGSQGMYHIHQTPIVLYGKKNHKIGDSLLRKGFTNLLYFDH